MTPGQIHREFAAGRLTAQEAAELSMRRRHRWWHTLVYFLAGLLP